jgi:hypothetical protein
MLTRQRNQEIHNENQITNPNVHAVSRDGLLRARR